MKRLSLLTGALLALALGGGLAAAPAPENLAGEERAVPTAVPTPAGDERGPVNPTRKPQAAPAFSLPAFVITGGGERKALANREDRGGALDTSGGLKASPGEQGAGKDQREAQASRECAQRETYTARAQYGQLRVAYGSANTFDASLLAAIESGRWFAWGEGQGAFSDGGPQSSSARHPALRRGGGGDLHLGWRMTPQDVVEASASASEQRLLWVRSSLDEPWLANSAAEGRLGWDGHAWGAAWRAGLHGGQWHQGAPALAGGAWSESEAGGQLSVARTVNGRTGSALLEAGVSAFSLQDSASASRAQWQGQGWLQSRFEAWSGSRLGLGLQWDQVGGDADAALLGPRFAFEQRLWRDLGLQASFATGLGLSRLGGPEASQRATQAWRPNPSLAPSRRVADARAALRWQGQGLSLGLEGAYTQDQAAFLPDDPAGAGLWVDSATGTLTRVGVTLKQRYQQGGLWQSLEAGLLSASLPERVDWKPTFMAPYWARAAAGVRRGPWGGELSLGWLGPREVSLTGLAPAMDAAWDLGAKATYELGPAVSLWLEGRNLLSQPVMDRPDYALASPYAGLGAELRF